MLFLLTTLLFRLESKILNGLPKKLQTVLFYAYHCNYFSSKKCELLNAL